MQGHNVLHPTGWDAFGLPAENAAIERGIDPGDWTATNIGKMKEQLKSMNTYFNWDAVCRSPIYFAYVADLDPVGNLNLFSCLLQTHAEAILHAVRERPCLPGGGLGEL